MRRGTGYYPAMSRALAEQLDPPTVFTQFRTPTIFWLWRYTGIGWPLAFAVIVLCGTLVAYLAWPIAGLGVTFWLTITAHTTHGAQWAYNETWALAFLLASIVALRRSRIGVAAAAVLVAALIRETTAVALVGGLVGALVGTRPTRPARAWILALAAFSTFIAWHAVRATQFVTPSGVGPGHAGAGLASVLEMYGAWLGPLGIVTAVIALWRSRGSAEWYLAAPLLVLPVVGLLWYRPYWSFVILPVAVATLRAPTASRDVGGERSIQGGPVSP